MILVIGITLYSRLSSSPRGAGLHIVYSVSLRNDYSSPVSPTVYDCWNSWSMESVDYFNKFVAFHIARF